MHEASLLEMKGRSHLHISGSAFSEVKVKARYSGVHMANISCQGKLLLQNKFKEEKTEIYFGFGVCR